MYLPQARRPAYRMVEVIVGIVLVILFMRFKTSEAGARKMDEWKMKAPIVGNVVKLNLFGQFARTLVSGSHPRERDVRDLLDALPQRGVNRPPRQRFRCSFQSLLRKASDRRQVPIRIGN